MRLGAVVCTYVQTKQAACIGQPRNISDRSYVQHHVTKLTHGQTMHERRLMYGNNVEFSIDVYVVVLARRTVSQTVRAALGEVIAHHMQLPFSSDRKVESHAIRVFTFFSFRHPKLSQLYTEHRPKNIFVEPHLPDTRDAHQISFKATTTMSSQTPPFHRLLSFYSNRNPFDSQTIRLQDSLYGNLALGLDFPVALAIALGRHIFLKNTGFFSLNIHVPSVSTKNTLLEGVEVEEKKSYSCSELVGLAKKNGVMSQADAAGVWALAADVNTGRIEGEDVVAFQKGTLLKEIERRRKDRSQVLPLWRGGPISVTGHSWMVGSMFGVQVYRDGEKDE